MIYKRDRALEYGYVSIIMRCDVIIVRDIFVTIRYTYIIERDATTI